MSELNPSPLLALRGVDFRYQRRGPLTLSGIDLALQAGQCTGIIGPNGAGKSTLLSLLSGLIKPVAGQLWWQGQPLPGNGRLLRQQVALVPQDFAFYPQLTVAANLTFFARLCGRHGAAQRVDDVAEATGLQALLGQRASRLSGGYQRRLNIAIGLIKRPRLLFLDEPTVGVDAEARQQIIALLQTLKQQGVSLVYTSHLLDEVEQLCEQVAILAAGRLTFVGAGNASQPRLRLTLSQPLTADQQLRLGVVGQRLNGNGRQLLLEPATTADVAELLAGLVANGARCDQLSLAPSPLQERYLAALSSTGER